MKKDRRWLKAVIAASAEPLPLLPWQRAARHQADTGKGVDTGRTTATAPLRKTAS